MTENQPVFVVDQPTRLEQRWIESRIEGSQGVLIQAKRQTLAHFKLNELPPPKPKEGELPFDEGLRRYLSSAHRTKLDARYHIAYQERGPGKKPLMASFGFIGYTTLQVLQIVTDHLNESGVPWLYLCDADGARLPQRCFSSDGRWAA